MLVYDDDDGFYSRVTPTSYHVFDNCIARPWYCAGARSRCNLDTHGDDGEHFVGSVAMHA
jgi:hypothetical protein